MNPLIHRVLLSSVVGIVAAAACGPFFPDTVLDLTQAALRVRATCMVDELIAIDRSHGDRLTLQRYGLAMVASLQGASPKPDNIGPPLPAGMPAELAAKTNFGVGQTRDEALEIARILLDKQLPPQRVAKHITDFTAWRDALPAAALDGPCAIVAPAPAAVPPPPEIAELPNDVLAYWHAARVFRSGDIPAARAAWQAILGMPANHHRAVWAAWMLAKTAPDPASARPFYQQCVALAKSGCADALRLAPLAMGWLAHDEVDPGAAIRLYFTAACSGEVEMFTSLRWRLPRLFLADDETLRRAAADPLLREIVTAMVFVMEHGPETSEEPQDDAWSGRWLACLEKLPPSAPSPAAGKAAWICYSRGDFAGAHRWLRQAAPDAGEVLWLRAKLALRDGSLDQAARLFAQAAPLYQFENGTEPDPPRFYEMSWYDHHSRRDWIRGQFFSDRAITHIGRGEFLRAMDFLTKAGYHTDAAYIAERVLTTDELLAWIKRHRPAHPDDAAGNLFVIGPEGVQRMPDGEWAGDPLRYLLGRRLAREFRFREAADFMPAAIKPHFEHYVKLHRAARSASWPDETRAAILWNLAHLRRHLGMEFFGYEGTPDNHEWGGSFEATDYVTRRSMKSGWHFDWTMEGRMIRSAASPQDVAVPPIAREELQRIATHRATCEERFHYRYAAADIAWRAASLLPDEHPATLFMLHEAGRWLANRDPVAADRFYQEIIRRCQASRLWPELDRRRWFLPRAPQIDLPQLPSELRFSRPDMAANAKNW